MDFKDYKQNLNFPLGVIPVVIFTLKKEQWHDRRGNIYKDRKLEKIWNQFKKDYIEGGKVTVGSYETFNLPDRPDIDLESEDILHAPEIAVTYGNSVRALNNLSVDLQNKLQFNVFFLNQDGEIVDRQSIEGLYDNIDFDFSNTDFSNVVSEYQEIAGLLEKLQKAQDEILEDKRKQEEEAKRIQNAMTPEMPVGSLENNLEQDTTNNTQDTEKTPTDDERGQKEHSETNSVSEPEEGNEEYEDNNFTPEQYLSLILNDKIDTMIVSKPVSDNVEYIDVEDQADASVRSLFNLYRDKIWNESIKVNNEINKTTNTYRKNVREELEQLVKKELEDLMTETDIDQKGTDFELAKRKFLLDYEQRKHIAEEDVDNFRISKEQELNDNREQYLAKIVAEATLKYNEEMIPILEKEVEDFSNKQKNALRKAREEGISGIESQANVAFQNGLDEIVPKILEKQRDNLNRLVKTYNSEIDSKTGAYKIFRETQISDLRKEANDNIKLANDYNRRTDSEVEALVKARIPELEVKEKELEVIKKQLADSEKRIQEDKVFTERYKTDYQEMARQLDEAKLYREKAETKAETLKESIVEEESKKRKRLSLASGAVLLVTILGSVTMVTSSNNAHNQETKKLEEKVALLTKKAEAKYRIGEYIPVDTGSGQVGYGKIVKIKGKTVYVEVKSSDGTTKSYNFKQD